MTTEQIAQCFQEVLDSPLVKEKPDFRHGVILAAHRFAAACVGTDAEFSLERFFRRCGL